MKNLTLGLLTLLALSSCADPVLELPAKSTSGQKKVAGGNTAAACPDLQGIYAKKDAADQQIEIYTKKEAPKVSYAFDNKKEFILADGQAKPITIDGVKVTFTLSCSATEVSTLKVLEGKTEGDTLKFTVDGDKQLKVEGTGSLKSKSGIYVKQAAAPIIPGPAACPTISGTYGVADGLAANARVELKIETKVEGDKFSYSRDGGRTFQLADGQEKRVDSAELKGTITTSCEAKSFSVVTKADGQEAASEKYTVKSDTELTVEGTGSAALLNGTYTKK